MEKNKQMKTKQIVCTYNNEVTTSQSLEKRGEPRQDVENVQQRQRARIINVLLSTNSSERLTWRTHQQHVCVKTVKLFNCQSLHTHTHNIYSVTLCVSVIFAVAWCSSVRLSVRHVGVLCPDG